jgi:hypothetical protein
MDNGFWLSLILAIPIGILVNILTRPIDRLLDSHVRFRALRRKKNTQQEYERVKRYLEHREDFYEFMLRSLVWIANWSVQSIVGIGAALMFLLADPQRLRIPEGVRQALFTITVVTSAVCLLMARVWWRRALDMAFRVRHFSEYESRVKSVLDSENHEGYRASR